MSAPALSVPPGFNARVRAAREHRKWTLGQVSVRTGLSAQTILRAEIEGRDVKLSTAAALAVVYGLSLDELAGIASPDPETTRRTR